MIPLAFAFMAVVMMGQQPAPLVSQTELPPPAAVQPQAPAAPAKVAPQAPPAQPAPPAQQGQFAQQQQAQPAPPAPVQPPMRQAGAQRSDSRSGGGKRVIAFWVILPDSSK